MKAKNEQAVVVTATTTIVVIKLHLQSCTWGEGLCLIWSSTSRVGKLNVLKVRYTEKGSNDMIRQ